MCDYHTYLRLLKQSAILDSWLNASQESGLLVDLHVDTEKSKREAGLPVYMRWWCCSSYFWSGCLRQVRVGTRQRGTGTFICRECLASDSDAWRPRVWCCTALMLSTTVRRSGPKRQVQGEVYALDWILQCADPSCRRLPGGGGYFILGAQDEAEKRASSNHVKMESI
jgi:hypothetical protein